MHILMLHLPKNVYVIQEMRSVGLKFGRDQSSWPGLLELLCRNCTRTVQIQSHRANAGAVNQSSCDYYRINVYYPFIDHVIQELDTRFSNEHEGLIAARYLIPFYLNDLSQEKIDSLTEYFEKFLTYEDN